MLGRGAGRTGEKAKSWRSKPSRVIAQLPRLQMRKRVPGGLAPGRRESQTSCPRVQGLSRSPEALPRSRADGRVGGLSLRGLLGPEAD